MSDKLSGRFERVRVYRKNGWPVAVIVSETNARCLTVLRADASAKSFGRLKQALAFVREKPAEEGTK